MKFNIAFHECSSIKSKSCNGIGNFLHSKLIVLVSTASTSFSIEVNINSRIIVNCRVRYSQMTLAMLHVNRSIRCRFQYSTLVLWSNHLHTIYMIKLCTPQSASLTYRLAWISIPSNSIHVHLHRCAPAEAQVFAAHKGFWCFSWEKVTNITNHSEYIDKLLILNLCFSGWWK